MKEILGNKIHFTSLGCARNLVDTEVMVGLLLQAGYEATPDLTKADYLVVNTCGFLESARQEGRDTIDELFKTRKPGAKIIVAGCMVRLHKDELKEKFPEIHYFLGAGDVEHILEAVRAEEAGYSLGTAKSYLEWGEVPRQVTTPRHYAYLKIAEGCKKQCAFCIIPKIKGKLQSKPQDQVVKEFQILLKQGAREVILIAQDLGDYGKDRGERDGLYQLLKRLSSIEGDYWIRLLYLYPDEITPEIIALMQSEPRICPYLDMPMQHINNDILKAMHRKTSREQIISTITNLRKAIPNLVLRTSLMVGFPGETEAQFEELIAFVEEYKLDNIGIFSYSREEESYSANLPNHLSDEVKASRLERLAAAQQKVVEEVQERHLGKKLKVLVEGYHPESKDLLLGRHYGQCPEIDGLVIINDWRKVDKAGEFYQVEITDICGYDLIGRVIGQERSKVVRKDNPSKNLLALQKG